MRGNVTEVQPRAWSSFWTRRRGRCRGLRACARILAASLPDEDEHVRCLEILEGAASLGPSDAVLVDVALRRGWALASADQSFDDVDGLRRLDPSSHTFLDDLGAAS